MSKRPQDDAERIAALWAVMERHDLDEVTLRVGETLCTVVRRFAPAPVATVVAAPAADGSAIANAVQLPPPNVKRVTAPLVGVFYRSAAPGTDTFVETGDRVEVGTVLCIVEAMKLMNEITSDFAGTVRRVIPQNGDLVALGEELFWIEP